LIRTQSQTDKVWLLFSAEVRLLVEADLEGLSSARPSSGAPANTKYTHGASSVPHRSNLRRPPFL
jgi:hypothetical protein